MSSPFPSRPPTRRGTAFTLVELLVVIGIIALLISILLPTLSKAREQGNWVACMSNMKQLGTALLMYSNENHGYLPRPASNGNGQYPDDIIIWRVPPTPPLKSVDDTVLSTYLNAKGDKLQTVFRCPSDNWADRPAQSGFGTPYRYSYTMNKSWDSWPLGTTVSMTVRRPKVTQVVKPAEKICLAEEKNPNDGRWEWLNIGVGKADELALRHAKQGNVLFVDWHVDRRFGPQLIADDINRRSQWVLDQR